MPLVPVEKDHWL